jgi:MarR family transcriptional regulator, organic hydroperoxide resistance regulator
MNEARENRADAQADEVNRAFHRVLHILLSHRQEFVDERLHGLTFAELHIVIAACERSDLILKELREELNVAQSTLSSMVSRLERKGFVRREISSRDMRSYGLQGTARGRRIVEEHHKLDAQQARELAQALTTDECTEFVGLLDKIADSLPAASHGSE